MLLIKNNSVLSNSIVCVESAMILPHCPRTLGQIKEKKRFNYLESEFSVQYVKLGVFGVREFIYELISLRHTRDFSNAGTILLAVIRFRRRFFAVPE